MVPLTVETVENYPGCWEADGWKQKKKKKRQISHKQPAKVSILKFLKGSARSPVEESETATAE